MNEPSYYTIHLSLADTASYAKTNTTYPKQHQNESTMPKAFMKPCIDCGQLTRTTRCEQHTKQLNQAKEQARDTPERRAKKRTMYGWQYQQARKALKATATECWICRQPFTPNDRIEADHLTPGDPHSPLAPAHRRCNQARGDKTFEQTFE